ncbi:MAG: PDZ domain-containing protein, partial [Asticcacaulis sp.]
MKRLQLLTTCAALTALLATAHPAHAQAPSQNGYYRFPALHGDQLAFASEGDVWQVSASGGQARRITTHADDESQVRISPDGRTLAFVASYNGAPDVYVMPIGGGAPRQVTFETGRVWLHGFSQTGEIIYSTDNVPGPTVTRNVRLLDINSGKARTLPLADANEASVDEAGQYVYFTRFGLKVTGDNARNYRGGAKTQFWRWALGSTQEAVRMDQNLPCNVSQPVASGGKIYVICDAGGTANLWSINPDGSGAQQLTRHSDYDVRSFSLHQGRIVYQHGADLRLLDLAKGTDAVIPVTLASDFEQRQTRWLRNASRFAETALASLDARKVVLTARGQIAVAAPGSVRRVTIDTPDQSRARSALLSRDGKTVYALIDKDGTSAVWAFPADGSPGGKQLAAPTQDHLWRLSLSPDGKSLALSDKGSKLWLIDTTSGQAREIDQAVQGGDNAHDDLSWSPDSRYLAFAGARSERDRNRAQIVLIDRETGQKALVTSDKYDSGAPAFSPDGQWLYFLSDRTFNPSPSSPWGDRNMGPAFNKRTKIYAVSLTGKGRFAFQPADELAPEPKTPDAKPADAAKAEDKKPVATGKTPAEAPKVANTVVWEGLAERLYEVPLPAGNYNRLEVGPERLYVLDTDDSQPFVRNLRIAELTAVAPKFETLFPAVNGFDLTADGKRLMVVKSMGEGQIYLMDAMARRPEDLSRFTVRLSDWGLEVKPADEWRQMFHDAWRMHRQFAYDSTMRGVDWNAVRSKYAPLVDRVNSRQELDDLLAQMIAEFGLLHSQIRVADQRTDIETAPVARLGAVFSATDTGLKIERIYRGEAETPSDRGPLERAAIKILVGDVLTRVNGQPVRTDGDLNQALREQSGQQVLIELMRDGKPLKTVVTPVAQSRESQLRYNDWVIRTREAVNKASQGRIGYVHLFAMGATDVASFAREFYANYDREGLIIDVRRNRGGNIDS